MVDAPKVTESSVPIQAAPPTPTTSTPPPQTSQPLPPPLPKVAAPPTATQQQAATVKLPPADPTKEISGTRSEYRVKMNRMRLRISQRLKDAQNTNAMLTTFNEIDMR